LPKGVVVDRAVDVTERASVAALADHAMERFGALDIWINNAGIYPYAELADLRDEEWERVMAINLRGAFFGGSEASGRMLAHSGAGGVILNIGSTAGFQAAGGTPTTSLPSMASWA
jgi:NAD(P)-dependent dehydrogenase (short-subunit alcohol dehydrogenase family)